MSFDKKNIIYILNDQKGQSLFELVLFVPILIYLLSLIFNFGNSINASINQQKAARGYTYYLLKGNSYGNKAEDLNQINSSGGDTFSLISSFIIGWRFQDDNGGANSFGTYFKLPNVPFDNADAEDCMEKTEAPNSSCIKVFTLYGVCGETYGLNQSDNQFFRVDYPGVAGGLTSKSLCTFR